MAARAATAAARSSSAATSGTTDWLRPVAATMPALSAVRSTSTARGTTKASITREVVAATSSQI